MQNAGQWINECPQCGFLSSTLEPGAGLAVEGVDALRQSNFAPLIERLLQYVMLSGARVLEIGSGHGHFLDAARARGCSVIGIEADPVAVAQARGRGHHVVEGFFPLAFNNDETFDVVALNDVFEHLPSPDEMAPVLESVLAPGGILVINLQSAMASSYCLASFLAMLGFDGPLGRLWQRGLPSPHVSYFNPRTLDILFERTTALSVEGAM
jgi:2-polyprenyl-3-methyl-5-hydroxy-6-metoxy-1,4-benzoquinol methylase